jgi:hypothetical protein
VFFLSANATADDVFSLKDADDNVESWTFVASRTGANEVTVGADAAESMANLATAIITDSVYWKAYYDATALASIYANGLIGVYAKTIKAFRCYITQTGGTLAGYVANYSAEIEYKSDPSIVIAIPTSDPAVAYSGFSQAKANLENGELHNVLAEDKIYSWNGDANSGTGEWYTMTEGLMPVATADAGGGTLGKVTADTDSGLDITGIGILVVKVDTSTIDFTAGGSLEVVDGGISADKLNSDVAGAGIVLNGTTNAIEANVDNSTLEVDTDVIRVKDDGITAAKINSDVAGAGLTQNGTTGALEAFVDSTTLEIGLGGIKVKDGGIDTTQLADDAVDKTKIDADVAGTGLQQAVDGSLEVRYDDVTITQDAGVLEVKDGGISNIHLADDAVGSDEIQDDAVTAAHINADVAGSGLVANGTTGALDVNVDGTSLEVATDVLGVKDGGISAAKLNSDVAGAGIILNVTTNAIDVNVDDSTIAIVSDVVGVKDAGIGTDQLAGTSVTAAKLGSDVAGSGLTGGNGSAIDVNAGTAIKIDTDAVAVDFASTKTNDNASAITVGQIVYVKADGDVDLAKADVANLDTFELGVVEDASIAATESGKIVLRRGAIIGGFSGLTPGQHLYVSRATAGAYQQNLTGFVAGEFVYSVGRAISATELLFNPEFMFEY